MEQNVTTILFALLRSAICGTKLTGQERAQYSPGMLPELLRVASRHDVAHLLVVGLKKNELLTKEDAKLEAYILKAVYRHERMRYAYEDLCNVLEEAQIPFLPLKGSVIREYYPEPWMRTSCDIDVLVHEEDLEKAIDSLKARGYICGERDYHDVILHSANNVLLELHFSIQENMDPLDGVLKEAWAYASPTNGFQYAFTKEFLAFHIYAHMAHHFAAGGCGIRSLLDIWLLEHNAGISCFDAENLLKRAKIDRFASEIRNLVEGYFTEQNVDVLSGPVLKFIIHGGTYGSVDNRVAIRQKKRGGRLGYLLSRAFLPYVTLKEYYPILEKHPWLMPAMQVRRWLKLLRPDVAQRTRRELQVNSTLDKGRSEDMHALLVELGLD